jgi:hypothetical protein
MPEYRESWVHFLLARHIFTSEQNLDWTVLGLWADATKKEARAARANSLQRAGHVYPLDASSTIKRGTNGAQTSVWPQMWRQMKKGPTPPSIQTLRLCNMESAGRSITLDFGPLCLMVRKLLYMMHCVED